ncbi:MAG TPA: hypothetical protein VEL68_07355 [Thermodesulfobacteriota bacterium]|nr:hypothetical protein [Thermodesulfobacteriota bacterium]
MQKKMKAVVPIAFLVFLWPALSWAQFDLFNAEDYNIEVEGRYWYPKLASSLKVEESGIGTEFDAVNDLGFDEKKGFGEGRLQIKIFNRHKFNFSYLPMKWEGDKVLTRTIQFSGQTYTAGTRVQSEADLKLFKAGYELDFIVSQYGFLGGSLDVMVTDVHAQLKAPSLALDEKEDFTVPIPMVGLIGRITPIKWINLTAKASGLPLGSYGHAFDAEAYLEINPIKYVGISAGYRYFSFLGQYDKNKADFRLDGPFTALKIRF